MIQPAANPARPGGSRDTAVARRWRSPILAAFVAAAPGLAAQERLEELVVEGYRIDDPGTITKLATPVPDTPMSVQVISRQVINDQAALRLEDVYINASGVVESGNTLNAQSEVLPVIRGFESPVTFRNGLRATQVGAVDLVNIESVEVLKGPASILFGALEPGGVVNYTTKRALADPHIRLQQSVGRFRHFRTTLDATGPLNSDGTLLYRFNAAYTDEESFRDELDRERIAIAPLVTWTVGDRTEIGFDASYTREEVPYDSGVPFGADGEPLVPMETFFGDPTLAGRKLEDLFVGHSLEHRFNSVFTLRSRVQFHRAEAENESIRNRGVVGDPGAEQLAVRYQNEVRTDDEYQIVADLSAEFTTGRAEHQMLLGIDLSRQEGEFDRFRVGGPLIPIAPDPDFRFDVPPDNTPLPAFRDTQEWEAVYVHDQISMLGDGRLKLLVGGRADWVDQEDELGGERVSDSEFTGRAGLLFEVTERIAPYVSVSQSFRPQRPNTRDRSGTQLPPETGVQYEGGFKFQNSNESLLATVALYDIEKDDVSVFDFPFFQETGEIAFFPGVSQSSRGVEIDVTGRIGERWRAIGNYALTDAESERNDTDPSQVGQRLGNVPERALRLWASYDFPAVSSLSGLSLSAGVRYESERDAQFDNELTLDSFTLLDLAARYEQPLSGGRLLHIQLNLRNVTDEEHYTRASDASIVHAGRPFAATGSIAIEF